MKKILIYMLAIATFASIFMYLAYLEKTELLKEQKQEEEALVNTLEKTYLAGRVECFNKDECAIYNGVGKKIRFEELYLLNRADFAEFADLLAKFLNEHLAQFELQIPDAQFLKTSKPLKKEFQIGIKKFELKNYALKDFAFLSWYIEQNTYENIINIFKNIDLLLKVKYDSKERKLDLKNLDLELTIKLAKDCNIRIFVKNEILLLNIENYDILKPILLEFKELFKDFLAKHQDFMFFTSFLLYYDELSSQSVKSITLSTKQHFDIKNILFTKSLKEN